MYWWKWLNANARMICIRSSHGQTIEKHGCNITCSEDRKADPLKEYFVCTVVYHKYFIYLFI